MQKNLKGGYQLISLGMTPIEDITEIDVELLKTTKRIVLTGISIDGKSQLPDKTVDIEYDDGDIIFKNVYGYDITVDANDGTVSVSEVQPSSGGTKLYCHTIEDDDGKHMVIINKSPTPINTTNITNIINAGLDINVLSLKCQEANDSPLYVVTSLADDVEDIEVHFGGSFQATFTAPFGEDVIVEY